MRTIPMKEVNMKYRTTKRDMLGYISQYVFNLKAGYYEAFKDTTIDIYYKDGREERFSDRELSDMKLPNMSEVANVVYSDEEETWDLFTRNILTEEEIAILTDVGVIVP